MKQEIRLIKGNIKRDFPEASISAKYVHVKNYIDSSDKIKIKTDIPYSAMLHYLNKHTTGAAIYPKGGYAAKYHDFGSSIFGMDSEVEFIEIESMDTMF